MTTHITHLVDSSGNYLGTISLQSSTRKYNLSSNSNLGSITKSQDSSSEIIPIPDYIPSASNVANPIQDTTPLPLPSNSSLVLKSQYLARGELIRLALNPPFHSDDFIVILNSEGLKIEGYIFPEASPQLDQSILNGSNPKSTNKIIGYQSILIEIPQTIKTGRYLIKRLSAIEYSKGNLSSGSSIEIEII